MTHNPTRWLITLNARPGNPAESWYLGIGALVNTAMFLFISIPMAETHLARYKVDYAAYRQQTRMLLPLPKK